MKIYRSGTGEQYTPFSHYGMTTQVIFNPEGGCKKANITLSTISKGTGSEDEVHPISDQIFYVIQGEFKLYAEGQLKAIVRSGDTILVNAGDIHSVINDQDTDCEYYAVTVPPLEKTH